jgi:translation initiation factor IF-3
VNREIRVPEVRVIDEEGKMLGVFNTQEALRLAEGKGLDLIEIAPTAKPPTCKIMDSGKYKYEHEKREKEAKKKQHVVVVKEIKIRPKIDKHDLEVKLRHCKEFLEDGDRVRLVITFRGREMAHQEFGRTILAKSLADLAEVAIVEQHPKFEGNNLGCLLAPKAPGKVSAPKPKTEAAPAPAAAPAAKAVEGA